ncbi:hypothetical protein PIB30_055042 [Stylosanthes scabra]|uniref:Uncharacterized protein n=1 Tax=Stylosanthes scabra TaxID=79078 RepID=A0ABU6UL01_9FABA|nr:hypothetical protein [Stylosanthes scabra]
MLQLALSLFSSPAGFIIVIIAPVGSIPWQRRHFTNAPRPLSCYCVASGNPYLNGNLGITSTNKPNVASTQGGSEENEAKSSLKIILIHRAPPQEDPPIRVYASRRKRSVGYISSHSSDGNSIKKNVLSSSSVLHSRISKVNPHEISFPLVPCVIDVTHFTPLKFYDFFKGSSNPEFVLVPNHRDSGVGSNPRVFYEFLPLKKN